jgi:hypothetical protein
MAATADPWPTAITIDTTADPDNVLQEALCHLGPT